MASDLTTIHSIGTVVGVISDFNAVFVKTKATVVETHGGGSSTATQTTRVIDCVVPAKILTRGSKGVKDYFNYEIGDMVYLLGGQGGDFFTEEMVFFAEEGRNYGGFIAKLCFVAGSVYTLENRPPAYYEGVRMIDFGDGTYIEYNTEDKNLIIECKGDVEINGKNIYLNG